MKYFVFLQVLPQPVPLAAREAGAGGGHRPDHHPGIQLVQKPTAERPCGRAEGRVRLSSNLIIEENRTSKVSYRKLA